eukprot:scaffold170769_cov28-Tisochrysis_lutea.AAC.11
MPSKFRCCTLRVKDEPRMRDPTMAIESRRVQFARSRHLPVSRRRQVTDPNAEARALILPAAAAP